MSDSAEAALVSFVNEFVSIAMTAVSSGPKGSESSWNELVNLNSISLRLILKFIFQLIKANL